MSLYYDAAAVLTSTTLGGSLKSRIYSNSLELKSKPAHLYALISETAKYDVFLKEVIDNAGLLAQEPKLTQILSLLLVQDQLFSKRGIAAPSEHPLRRTIERHKARLQAEFTKARLRRRCASTADLKRHLLAQKPAAHRSQPRWIRINTLRSSLEQELIYTFRDFRVDASITEVAGALGAEKVLAIDHNVPDLIALPPDVDVTKTPGYESGIIILQDKASCFPAYLLVGVDNDGNSVGDCIDACAAPGNKTSHLAALLSRSSESKSKSKIYACERDPKRSKTLETMMERSGAGTVVVKAECDFLTLDPHHRQFNKVTHLLLDPSCSGSGILGREDMPALALPDDTKANNHMPKSKKRKRNSDSAKPVETTNTTSTEDEETRDTTVDKERLRKLSNLQTRIVEHALSFPAAVRVTYSTCSVHVEENEAVVARVLASTVAKERGWHLLQRDKQVSGLRSWPHRGISRSELPMGKALDLQEKNLEACIRCHPGDAEGTMGFFVCCFVRSAPEQSQQAADNSINEAVSWEGFND